MVGVAVVQGNVVKLDRFGQCRWQGDLHKWHTGTTPAQRKLTRYRIAGLPLEVAHVRRDVPRGPWVMHLLGEDVGTEQHKTTAQIAVEQVLGLR